VQKPVVGHELSTQIRNSSQGTEIDCKNRRHCCVTVQTTWQCRWFVRYRTNSADLEAVTSALHRLDPIWELLYPKEQRRVLEMLVDEIDVGKTAVTVPRRWH
jgi:hypothetical protein